MTRAFLIGAAGYPLLEILARGRTHWSMSVAGGASAACVHAIAKNRWPLWAKASAGGTAVTAVEALCGLIWNRDHRVWDYRAQPLNWRGQVCARFSALWCLIAMGWMCLDKPSRLE